VVYFNCSIKSSSETIGWEKGDPVEKSHGTFAERNVFILNSFRGSEAEVTGLPIGDTVFLFGGLLMSFINHFKSSLKKGQSVVEFLVLATAILAAVALGGPALIEMVGSSGSDIVNRSAAKMEVTLRGNATDFLPLLK
jgi:hypothetical protein